MPRRDLVTRWGPAVVALAALAAGTAVVLGLSLRETAGILVFPLDDPYIHMAMARNLAAEGVYGINRDAFTSSSSSPLWTLLLAGAYRLTGPSTTTPLVLNIVLATLLVVCMDWTLRRRGVGPLPRALTLIALVGLIPLPTLAFLGQEHVLHSLLVLAFADGVARAMPEPADRPTAPGWRPRERAVLMLLPAALVMTRYESLALILVACLVLLVGRRPKQAIAVGAFASIPVLAFGLYSTSRGFWFLPNPIVLKSKLPASGALSLWTDLPLGAVYAKLAATPHLVVLVLVATAGWYFLWRERGPDWNAMAVVSALYVPTTVLHLQYAELGWLFRYEAYLVALGIFALALFFSPRELPQVPPAGRRLQRVPGVVLVVLVVAPLVERGWSAFRDTPRAARNIYQQQYQMGTFLARFYAGQTVALNDIGAASFLGGVDTVDLWGLADVQVAAAIRQGRFDTSWIESYARRRGVRMAVLYRSGFTEYGGLPASWVKVGRWTVDRNVILGSDTVHFFAVRPDEAAALTRNLATFSARLPRGVEYVDLYGLAEREP